MPNVGWLVPAAAHTQNMTDFEQDLAHFYGAAVNFPYPQYLGGDNTDPKMANCVNALLHGGTQYDIFAVAGSTGVAALVAQGAQNIVQVAGGNPAYDGVKKITGHHIDAAGVAAKQVKALKRHHPGIGTLTVLYDDTSDTYDAALTAARTEAAKPPVIHVNPLLARNPAAVHALVPAQVVGMFMLCPSGMFYDAVPKQDIITLVAGAGVPAIFPEKEFTSGHPHWWHLGHNINKTYKKAAKLANDLLRGTLTPGGEAPDMDNNT